MTNPEHLQTLKQGVETWNRWREDNPLLRPELSRVVLNGMPLAGANLSFADLFRAALSRTNLSGVDLRAANLRGARLTYAELKNAILNDADLSGADLYGADLTGAELLGASFSGADLRGADFSKSLVGWTRFDDNVLSKTRGLEAVRHEGPSTVGIDTLYKTGSGIPEIFLRGCGLSDRLIQHIHLLLNDPRHFYSCFISYSSKDQEFAERLHADLQAKGVRVWFAPHDLKIGAHIRHTIDESIRVYDKLLLVLSEHSVSSQWVEQEVETALAKERELGGKTVLFPVRIDDAVIETKSGWPALLKNTRNVGDFTRWKEHDPYQRAFERLLRNLKAGT